MTKTTKNPAPGTEHYNKLYSAGYMSNFTDIYEWCRHKTVRHMLGYLSKSHRPERVLDVGCGQGRYIGLAKTYFGDSAFSGVDFSDVAIAKARENHPDGLFFVSRAEELSAIPDASIDLLITIELLEHVYDVKKTVSEFSRVLKPNGWILFTTPCANRFSFEWFQNYFSKTLQKAKDGFNRFGTDPYEHVRRLTSDDVVNIFSESGLQVKKIRFRAHFFTRIAWLIMESLKKRKSSIARSPATLRLLSEFAYLDWRFFRFLPNGATMIGLGRKPNA